MSVGEDDPDDATNDPDEVAARPAIAGILGAGDTASPYHPVTQHRVIVVCHSALRKRTRWHLGLVRRRTRRCLCPGCGRPAFWEVIEHTRESAEFTWEAGNDER